MTIELRNITASYSENKVFYNFSGKISYDNLVVLMGKNGIGKSTLLDVIAGLKKIDSGSLYGIPYKDPESIFFNPAITSNKVLFPIPFFPIKTTKLS